MNEWVARVLRVIFVLLFSCGIAAAFAHHIEASGDSLHQEHSCETCIAFRAVGAALAPDLALPAIGVVLAFATVIQVTISTFVSQRRHMLHSALDPPAVAVLI